jgi:hypothetical protein
MTVRRKWLLGLGLAAIAAAVLYVRDPFVPGRYPPCLFHLATGWHCPGCGSVRAAYELLHLHLAQAFGLNPLFVLTLPLIAWAAGRQACRDFFQPDAPTTNLPSWFGWTYLAVVLAFWLLRNLPWEPVAWMAP